MSGSRIIELNNLQKYVADISKHVLICSNPVIIKLFGEVKRQGLHSVVGKPLILSCRLMSII